MEKPIETLVIAGGGSAGFITALSFRILLPQIKVIVVHSANIPVIGVGESTTQAFVDYFHKILNIDRGEFFREVRPSWKLGLQLQWGDPQDTHFNYPFEHFLAEVVPNMRHTKGYYCLDGMSDTSHFGAMMDRGLAPCADQNGRVAVDPRATYHIPNRRFLAYMTRKVQELGAEVVDGEIVGINQHESGNVKSLSLKDGREIEGDLFVDCSGFKSMLLEKTMGAEYVTYQNALVCDAAVVGSWDRADDDTDIHPYTVVESMDNGWCWQIDFLELANRGYVFSTAFCTPDEAMREMKEKNPLLGDDLKLIRFPSGRYDRFWIGNVVGLGNSCGFVEPLEATALNVVISQCWNLIAAIRDDGRRPSDTLKAIENRRYRETWDDVRDFLTIHYKFNRRLDTAFWRDRRENTPLGGAEEIVDVFREVGPAVAINHLVPAHSLFGFTGYMNLLIGQRVDTKVRPEPTEAESRIWEAHRQAVREAIRPALPVKEALMRVYKESHHWKREGI